MTSIADRWWNEDRRDLFRSAEVLASETPDATRLAESFNIILTDLELYDDPRQGAGLWLYENELLLAERLGEELHNLVRNAALIGTDASAGESSDWPSLRATAVALLRLMEANGDFPS